MDYLEGPFGVDMFNKSVVKFIVNNYLNYKPVIYRSDFENKFRYENLPMISMREFKALTVNIE